MKKTLIALAAVAATGAAFAQSSVTIYGVADLSVGAVSDVVSTGTDKDGKSTTGLGISNDDFQAFANGTMNNGNSRVGFRGVEDLGGGLKAGFNFEQGVNAANGATDSNTFQRAANMSLMGGFGEIRAGRSLTTSYYSMAAWDLTGAANYSVVAKQFSFVGSGSRSDAAVMYFSPNFGGFNVGASTVLKGNAGEAKYDFSLGYSAGPLVASFAYNTQKNGVEGYSLGAKYNLGMLTLAGSYQNAEDEATGVTRAEGFTLGGTMNIGPVALTVDIARDTENKDTDWLLEAKYPLSKRTFVYGVVLGDGKGDVVNAAGKAVGVTTQNTTAYAIGVRHNF